MINVLGWQLFVFLIALITIISGAAAFLFKAPEHLVEFLGLFSKTGFVLSLVVFGVGQSPIFPWLCKHWPLNLLVPSLDGSWRGTISSNWPVIAAAHKIKDKDGKDFTNTVTPVSADICVRLFSISIELKSDTGYQNSKTLTCALKKNSHRGFELSYVYKSSVLDPKLSDEQGFYGAGLIDFTSRNPSDLEGVCWTNRKWKAGHNTAGTIKLIRS